jgi:hypothetical protein
MIANHVGALYPDRFDGIALGKVQGASVGATGNAVATIPITSGTAYIVRQITVANANATIATANVAILTSNDGNTSNAVSNNVVLANVSQHNYLSRFRFESCNINKCLYSSSSISFSKYCCDQWHLRYYCFW